MNSKLFQLLLKNDKRLIAVLSFLLMIFVLFLYISLFYVKVPSGDKILFDYFIEHYRNDEN
jgi:hypothetical protein